MEHLLQIMEIIFVILRMSTEIRIFAIRLFAQFRSIFPFCSIYVVDLFHAPVLGDEPIAQNQN